MRRTLLDMVQGILSALDSDPVNSLTETNEAMQVAERLREAYFDLIEEQGLKANCELTSLVSLSDLASPHCLRLPHNASRLVWFKYNTAVDTARLNYITVPYKNPLDFVNLCNSLDSTDTVNNFVWNPPTQLNLQLTVGKLADPSYWTTFDDDIIVFNSYNSAVESTLQEGKTQAYCELLPSFSIEDTHVPDLPDNLFTQLYNTALNRCFTLDKESINPKFEQQENRNRVRSQRLKFRQQHDQNKLPLYPDYGRRRGS